jgi:hypothetical protein
MYNNEFDSREMAATIARNRIKLLELSFMTGINKTTLSLIKNGWLKPTDSQVKKITIVLNKSAGYKDVIKGRKHECTV